ncbi:MAG TPA: hypothetical protein VJA66_09575 [Thermoanaerobaculia bacterium]
MSMTSRLFRRAALSVCAFLLGGFLFAATYLPISDAELAQRSPVVVRAHVDSVAARLETLSGRTLPMTIVRLQALEVLRGRLPDSNFRLILSGGHVGDRVLWVPGTPSLQAGQEAILFLRPVPGRRSDYFLSEFGLSHFDIRSDAEGRRFAVRPVFSAEEDAYLSKLEPTLTPSQPGSAPLLRDASSLVAAVKAVAAGHRPPEVFYARPIGGVGAMGPIRPLWVNIGGREPGNCGGTPCLFRWFWDTAASPNGVVTISGTQSNLSDSSNGTPTVQNAVNQWHGVVASDVRYSGPAAGGNVSIQLDAPSSFDGGVAFNTPLPCGSGGVLGLGGPQSGPAPIGGLTFKGDANYFPVVSGTVTMRIRTGPAGCYDVAVFLSGVLHEMGHTLGLGHPDTGQSTHSTTTAADWSGAVMKSVIPASHPSTPQTDDIQAIQYYYGTGVIPTPTPTLSVTPTRTPTGISGTPRGHVTPLHFVTPKPNVNGRS